MGIKIRTRKIKGGVSFYLDIYHNGRRYYENLKIFSLDKDGDRKTKKAEAEVIRSNRIHSLGLSPYYSPYKKRSASVVEYIRIRGDNSLQVNKRRFSAIVKHLLLFANKKDLQFFEITPTFCSDFRDYLGSKLQGETPHDYFKHFKKMLNDATGDGYLDANPCLKVKNANPASGQLRKDVLTDDEIAALLSAPCGNMEVRRAFLFACMTGIRCGDIRSLIWGQVDLKLKEITFEMNKTGKEITVPLNKAALTLIGFPRSKNDHVFHLPSQGAVNKVLKHWARRASIEKHVTFHVARHSFITSVYRSTRDLKLAGSLAGHSSIKHTEKYAHICNESKRDAVNQLPDIIGL